MKKFRECARSVIFTFLLSLMVILNILIQLPKFLTNKEDYENMYLLIKNYTTAGFIVDMEKPYYSLTKLASDTAKYYFYVINNPKYNDIIKLDGLRELSSYWGHYIWKNKRLSNISYIMQDIDNNPSYSAMKLLEYTNTNISLLQIRIIDLCFCIRYKDNIFYLILQLVCLLGYVGVVYIFNITLNPDYYEKGVEDDY